MKERNLELRGLILKRYSTIKDFCACVDINIYRMSRIISGVSIPDVRDACKMADCLGVSIDYLAELMDRQTHDKESTNEELSLNRIPF